jgi:hypothetical protein
VSATPPAPPPGAPPSAPRPAGAKAIVCPGCGAPIALRALGQSVVVACPSCQSIIDITRPEIRLILRYQGQAQRLRLPLGTRGTLRGQELEVIGAMGRSSKGYSWEEYLLYSPYLGFRWLVFDQGHWNFGKAVKDAGRLEGTSPVYEGRSYRWCQGGDAQVDWVMGEFYWQVRAGSEVATADYVAPPFMLSREQAADEVTWTQLIYLEPEEVEAAFRVRVPRPDEPGVNQPNAHGAALRELKRMIQIALGCALAIQLVTMLVARNATVPVGQYNFAHDPGEEEQVFGPFALRSGHSLNQLSARANLQNSWVELDCALVNDESGEVFRFANEFEFYSGVDSDGAWSEGKRYGETLLVGIPSGNYHLLVDGSGRGQNGQQLTESVGLTLHHDVVPWRNFWLSVLLILLYPGYLFLRSMQFEQQRYSEQVVSPTALLLNRLKSRLPTDRP